MEDKIKYLRKVSPNYVGGMSIISKLTVPTSLLVHTNGVKNWKITIKLSDVFEERFLRHDGPCLITRERKTWSPDAIFKSPIHIVNCPICTNK